MKVPPSLALLPPEKGALLHTGCGLNRAFLGLGPMPLASLLFLWSWRWNERWFGNLGPEAVLSLLSLSFALFKKQKMAILSVLVILS